MKIIRKGSRILEKVQTPHSPELKAEIVLEVIFGLKSLSQIAIERSIHGNGHQRMGSRSAKANVGHIQDIQWPEKLQEQEIERLHQKIGQLTVENDFLPRGNAPR